MLCLNNPHSTWFHSCTMWIASSRAFHNTWTHLFMYYVDYSSLSNLQYMNTIVYYCYSSRAMLNAWMTMCTQCYSCMWIAHNAWITMCTHCHSCIVDCSILEYTIVYTMLFMYCSIAQCLNNNVYTMLFKYCGMLNTWMTMCTQCYSSIVDCSIHEWNCVQ